MQEMSQQVITRVEQESTNLVEDLLNLFPGETIDDEAQLTTASEALTRIAKQIKIWQTKRVELVKPANEYVKTVNASFQTHVEPVKREENRIRMMMSQYRAKVQAERAAQYKEAQKEAEKAFPTGSPIPEVVAPIPEDTVRQVDTDHGRVGFTTVWKYQIVDPKKVPRKYWIIDEVTIGKLVKAGERSIPGVKIYAEEVPTVRGR